MSCTTGHWGEEMEQQRGGGEDWGLSAADMEDLLTPQPPDPTPPALHQPSPEETPSFQILPAELCRTDPLVLQTIRLLQHQRQVAQLIARAQTVGVDSTSLPSCPPPPEDLVLNRKTTKPHFLNFLPPEHTPFTTGKTQQHILEVEGSTARLILRKAVATICAHTGYTDTSESVLRLLTDVTHEFLTKITRMLRANTDNLLLTDRCPFHDVVEKTLHDVGMGSMSELHQMYRDRVMLYHAKVRQETLQLYHHYVTLSQNREAANTPGSRRESIGDWWMDECGSQQGAGQGPGMEEASVPSIKSTSSLDPELSLHPFSVLSQAGGDGEEPVVQNSPATSQTFPVYPLTPR
ncbi:STAGA complex 65 subunit gamma-like [Portunus trituberculatus]|uniref:STAGA complex 65 subunit gamma-like n=1 Tax=Portunus trituberculatus TaxID=210409 RepID=UPI001E1D1A5D|nr:STAGA complex 65 subunit gamma-like [Portunus trituberculatus]XP_045101109.1 STAGA complex 65 subunit gamma-like [Portunus trituberculatus]